MTASAHSFSSPKLVVATFGSLLLCWPGHLRAAEPISDAGSATVAGTIDRLLGEHWRREGISPAAVADDTLLFRRLTLDLAGRIPTVHEFDRFKADPVPDRYARSMRRLLEGPEFAWYFG